MNSFFIQIHKSKKIVKGVFTPCKALNKALLNAFIHLHPFSRSIQNTFEFFFTSFKKNQTVKQGGDHYE